jgi:prepilin-type N-terminal cleavage/methylation domain-containing protein
MTQQTRAARGGFTMIEVLTVAAIAVIIMGLTIPAMGWMRDSRDREKVAETIAAQVMGARALAVQNRTYTAVMVRSTASRNATPGNQWQCGGGKAGIIRIVMVHPSHVSDTQGWANCFHFAPERPAEFIPAGIGFVRGESATAPAGGPFPSDDEQAVVNSHQFFIVFGPDGVLRRNYEIRFVYNDVGATGRSKVEADYAAGTMGARAYLNYTTAIYPATCNIRFSTDSFAIFDTRKIFERIGANWFDGGNMSRVGAHRDSTNLGPVYTSLMQRLYPGFASPTVSYPVADDLLVRRTVLNPYTGLGIQTRQELNTAVGGNVTYTDLD